MSDRESDVRDTASKSLSLLICFCDDKDKLTSLVDSCLDVIVDDTIPIDNGLQVIGRRYSNLQTLSYYDGSALN